MIILFFKKRTKSLHIWRCSPLQYWQKRLLKPGLRIPYFLPFLDVQERRHVHRLLDVRTTERILGKQYGMATKLPVGQSIPYTINGRGNHGYSYTPSSAVSTSHHPSQSNFKDSVWGDYFGCVLKLIHDTKDFGNWILGRPVPSGRVSIFV